jgi:hypothetical protein
MQETAVNSKIDMILVVLRLWSHPGVIVFSAWFLSGTVKTLRHCGYGPLDVKVGNQIFRNGIIVRDLNSLIIFAQAAEAKSFLRRFDSTVSRHSRS